MCLAQGHNAVLPVRLEPATPQSRDKHSTIEPLGSLKKMSVALIQQKCCVFVYAIVIG